MSHPRRKGVGMSGMGEMGCGMIYLVLIVCCLVRYGVVSCRVVYCTAGGDGMAYFEACDILIDEQSN